MTVNMVQERFDELVSNNQEYFHDVRECTDQVFAVKAVDGESL